MLQRLYIKNVALIPEADIVFDGGLNVLSGETGSGKSVILDSINFVLGSKADKTMIRSGEREAIVRAEFYVAPDSAAAEKTRALDIDTDGEIIITRKLNSDGRSAVKLNGNTVTAGMLKSVTQHLVDVHGQSEHFFLLNEENQLKVIDGICGEKAAEFKRQLATLISEKRGYLSKIKSLGGDESERERKLDLLKFQIDEIRSAGIEPGEFDRLKAKQIIFANTEKMFAALNAVHGALSDDGGCNDAVSSALHLINGISDLDKEYAGIAERLESLAAEVSDISETVADLAENLTYDDREAQFVDERLEVLKTLKRKYGDSEQKILEFAAGAEAEYDMLSGAADEIAKAESMISACSDKIYMVCRQLSDLRRKNAETFCSDVTRELGTLNIPNASFKVEFGEFDRTTADHNSAEGSDSLRFMFSANKGEPEKPLKDVISGGEMSRFMLAVKTRLKDLNGISTYVFDEIDAGISGYTAKTVAEKFKYIAKNTQIIAVSHLPQVCAASDAQFLIYKTEENSKTLTKIKRLNDAEKIDEIVRLTGNVKSEAAKIHAGELIDQFKN